jgi:hypothetical protein
MDAKVSKVGKAEMDKIQAEGPRLPGLPAAYGTVERSTVTHLTAAPHSVEISRNASGGVSISVKCYGATLDEAMKWAVDKFTELDAGYPVAFKVAK